MRINNDCVRDILLAVESESTYEKAVYFRRNHHNIPEQLKKYELNTVLYHVRNLIQAGYLYKPSDYDYSTESEMWVDLSPSGHEFLNTIRDPEIWRKTKNNISKAGSFSLKIVSSVAEGIAKAYISQVLNLPIS